MRKMWRSALALLLSAILLCGAAPTSFAEGGEIVFGTCGASGDGSNATWELNTGTGEMTIRGTGEMKGYSSSSVPSYSYRDTIRAVTIENGVTGIGEYAFYFCGNPCLVCRLGRRFSLRLRRPPDARAPCRFDCALQGERIAAVGANASLAMTSSLPVSGHPTIFRERKKPRQSGNFFRESFA